MKIKVGDKVKVITGTNKGKEGKVSKVLRSESRVIVEGVNIVKKHVKPGKTNETGGILSDQESLLYRWPENHGPGPDAPLGGLSPAEGIRVYPKLEPQRFQERLRSCFY